MFQMIIRQAIMQKSVLLLVAIAIKAATSLAHDPLPSWNESSVKARVIDFVQNVTNASSSSFVPIEERIAVFDNDGTLWPENPLPFQLAFAIDTLRQKVLLAPQLAEDAMVKAALNGDLASLISGPHHEGLLRVIALTHAGMTIDQFRDSVDNWIKTATHPKYGVRYDELTYKPMQELLSFLRSRDFKIYIVSGGGADFMRVWSERIYGIPPEQVIGSTSRTVLEFRDGIPTLVKTLDHLFVDDKAGKPVGIHHFIGRRPIACFGNSDGDLEMLQYTTISNPRPSFGMIIHHTDENREYAYDSAPKSSGKLVEALRQAPQRGWAVVDMESDWKKVFNH
jgi:phosphoserine phosphatase